MCVYMDKVCSTCNGEETGISGFCGQIWGKRLHLEDPCLDEMIILKRILKTGRKGVDWIALAQERDKWWDVVNAVMNIQIPQTRRICLLDSGLLASQNGIYSLRICSVHIDLLTSASFHNFMFWYVKCRYAVQTDTLFASCPNFRNTETRAVLFLLHDPWSDTGSKDTSTRYKPSQIFAFSPAEPFLPSLLPCIRFFRPRGDSTGNLMRTAERDLMFSRRWSTELMVS